jgi:hypothetical protein
LSAFRQGKLSVLLHINGIVFSAQEISLGDREYQQFTIPVASLKSGVAVLTVVSNTGKLLAERRFYMGEQETVTATLTPLRTTVQTRGLVEVEVKLTDGRGTPVAGEIVVSAVNQRLFGDQELVQFHDELIFNRYEQQIPSQAGRSDLFDLRLATIEPLQGPWVDAPAPPLSREAGVFLHFNGTIVDKKTLEPVPDSTQLLLYLQKDAMGYVTSTSSGVFDLHTLLDFNGTDEAYYEAEFNGRRLPNVKITWNDLLPRFNASSSSKVLPPVNAYADFRAKTRVINKSYGFFTKSSGPASATVINPNQLLEEEAGGADVTVNLNDYIAFPNMDEVIREIIPSLFHRKQGDRSIVRVGLQNTDKQPRADPLYVIDGLMTRDTEYFMALKPSEVLTIKVVRDVGKLALMGPFGNNGIVFVQTKLPNPQRVRASSNFTSLHGVSRRIPVKSIDHTSISQPLLPDFRSTLYWNPAIKTDAQGKAVIRFFASDDVGPIRLDVVGLTDTSIPFSGTTTVQVEFAEEVYKR